MRREKIKIDENGISLEGRWKRGFLSMIFSRTGLVILFLLIQAAVTLVMWVYFGELVTKYFVGGQTLFVFVVLIYMLNDGKDPNYKLAWMLFIVVAPFFGVLLYLWMQIDPGNRAVKMRLHDIDEKSLARMQQDGDALTALGQLQPESASLARYLYKTMHDPVYRDTAVRYFPLGDEVFPEMLRQLEKAEHFIFLEYFIIREGAMWGRILEVLARKAAEGVEVRVMYDGTCEMGSMPRFYPRRLEELGIRCKVWLRLKPFITSAYNYRDHRKIMVIDGKVAFNGGVNLSDEYINRRSRFGHWKDSAVMLSGSAARSFTSMFLEMWNLGEKETEDASAYLSAPAGEESDPAAQGFVIPYADSPLDAYRTGKMVYEDILNTAEDYVYIMTPYLILDGELESALKFAADRGVDVRLLLPGIPDKPMVWYLGKRHYKSLMASGVRIWEYTPGFLHAKSFVSDDCKAVVGSVNLDYRSLYHHFECGSYLAGTPCIGAIKADFLNTLACSREITEEELKHEKLSRRAIGAVMKLIAPLL